MDKPKWLGSFRTERAAMTFVDNCWKHREHEDLSLKVESCGPIYVVWGVPKEPVEALLNLGAGI